MISGKRIVAVIPARGGSKRLPRKNVLELAGKPLIAWTIEAALDSKYIDRVLVSTDDDEIKLISKQFGAEVPFDRPKQLASDEASSESVLLHTLDDLECSGDTYQFVVMLQPTSPLRKSEDIDSSIEFLEEKAADAVISVCKSLHSPLWSNTLPKDFNMSNFIGRDIKGKRSQDLPDYYQLNGGVYVCSVSAFRKEKSLFINDNIYAYVMRQSRSIDIDNWIDYKMAEMLIKEEERVQ
jgi:CMP-N,N'-diacetyllegionaminic acid synthase